MASDSRREDDRAIAATAMRPIQANLVYLVENLDTLPCLDHLEATDHITGETLARLSAPSDPTEKARGLLHYIRTASQGCYNEFVTALRLSNQHAVADRLTSSDTPVVQSIHPNKTLQATKLYHPLLVDNLRFEDSLLVRLEGRGVITSVQADHLRAIPTRRERARALLKVMLKGETPERTRGFVSSLHETDQPHLALLVETGDVSSIISNDVKDAVKKHKLKVIDGVREEVDRTSITSVLSRLEERHVITPAQTEAVQAMGSPERRLAELADIILCRPLPAVEPSLTPNLETSQIDFQMLEPGAIIQPIADLHCPSSKYLSGLRDCLKSTQLKLNSKLNKRFGIDCKEHPFYIRLSMGCIQRTNRREMEDYIQRTAQKVETNGDIDLGKLFDSTRYKDEAVDRVLLLGGAGSGKSTVTQQIAYGWASGRIMGDVIAAFHFECRSFTPDIKKEHEFTLGDLLFKMHGPGHVTDEEIQSNLRFLIDHQSKIQITFDGLDELSRWGEPSPDSTYPITDPFTTKAQIHCLIHNVINKNLLPKARVLVTSRPTSTVDESEFTRCVAALGFSEESIRQCMQALCGERKEVYESIMAYLEEYPELYTQCVLPLNCVFLGAVLRLDLSSGESHRKPFAIDSITRLNARVVLDNIWKRSPQRPKSIFHLTKEQTATMRMLAQLAAKGLLEKEVKITFDDDDLDELAIEPDDDFFGLLEVTCEESLFLLGDRPVSHAASFIHLSVQEFLGALHIALTWDPAEVQALSQPGRGRLDMVQMFVCGLLGDLEGAKFLKAFDATLSSEIITQRAEAFFDTISLRGEGTSEGTTKLGRLHVLRCVAEGKMAALVPRLESWILEDQDGFQSLDLTDCPGGLLPHHLGAVGYWLRASSALDNLVLKNCGVTHSGIAALQRKFSQDESGWSGLRKLILTDNPLGDKGAECLTQFLARNTKLAILQLEGCSIGPVGLESLADNTLELTSLDELWFYENPVGDGGLERLIPLISRNTSLKKLLLWEAGLGNEGVAFLSRAIGSNSCITDLYLQRNAIGDEGAKQLAEILRANPSINKLVLSFNKIGDLGAGRLAEAVRDHAGIGKIHLSNNRIEDSGAEQLADALRVNPRITTLNLRGCLLSDEIRHHLKEEFGVRLRESFHVDFNE